MTIIINKQSLSRRQPAAPTCNLEVKVPPMISPRLAAAMARRNWHYGWVVVGVTFLTMLTTAGAMGAPGVFIVPLPKGFGWQTSEISSGLAIRLPLIRLMGPV